MNRIFKWTILTIVAVLLGAVLIRALGHTRKDPPNRGDDDTIHAPSHVKLQNGMAVVTLNGNFRQRAGITVAMLQPTRRRAEATAPAMVLNTEVLATFCKQYVAGRNQVKKAGISARVQLMEYERLKKLYAENQNISAKALQAAQGQLLRDQADLGTARQQLQLQRAGVSQNWGSVVGGWVASDAPSLKRVLNLQDVLVEVTIPAGRKLAMPRTLQLEIPAGGTVTASLVSTFPRVDPRIQGVSLLYLAPARPGLVPGVNPVAYFGVGRFASGVVLPSSAVVWWQGNAWVYQETGPGRFTRRPVAADRPVSGGYFVTRGFAPGNRIVVRGAQELLSEEFRSQIQPED